MDGIGTKHIYDPKRVRFKDAAIDSLAMNLNDIVLQRATPYIVIDHIIIPQDDNQGIIEIIETLCEECKKRQIATLCGETAICNTIQHIEISTTMLGFIENPRQNKLRIGDTLIGFRSSGVHSNGLSKVREIYGKDYLDLDLKPTIIYSDKVLELEKKVDIHGMVNITGGAFTKIRGYLAEGADVKIRRDHGLQPHNIFREIYSKEISDEEIYKTFNCGIGFIVSVNKNDAPKVLWSLDSDIIGEVIKGTGKIRIESTFSDTLVEY